MKSSIELKEMRNDIIDSLEVIKETATAEERDLTSEENNEMDSLLKNADELSAKIERAERTEDALKTAARVSGTKIEVKEDKEIRDYSFQDALSQAANGRLEGLIKEMDQEARNESRYTGQSYKGIGIPSSILTRMGKSSVDAVS